MTIKFKFSILPSRYLKRFGIEVPDDSMDLIVTEDASCCGKKADGCISGDAEDAEVSYDPKTATSRNPSKEVEATLKECEAKNPMTCRFHGMTALANDIEGFLGREGIRGNVKVEILGSEKNSIFCEATVDGVTDSDVPAIKNAMKNFYSQPGVTGDVDDIFEDEGVGTAGFDLDVDKIDLAGRAKKALNQSPAVQQPSKAPQNAQNTPPAAQTASAGATTPPVQPKPQNAVSAPNIVAPTKTRRRRKANQPPQTQQTALQNSEQKPSGGDASATASVATTPSAVHSNGENVLSDDGSLPNEPVLFPDSVSVNAGPYTDDEIKFIKDASMTIWKMLRRADKRIAEGKPNKIEKSGNFDGFVKMDLGRLTALSERDPHGQVKGLVGLANKINSCRQGGWQEMIEPEKFDATAPCTIGGKYDGKTGEFDFSSYKFDEGKYGLSAVGAAKGEGHDPKTRKTGLEYAETVISEGGEAPVAEAEAAKRADGEMKELEEGFRALESNRGEFSGDMYGVMRHFLGMGYKKAYDAFKAASEKCGEFVKNMFVQKGTIAETIEALKKRGKKVPLAMEKWQDVEDRYEDKAWKRVAAHFDFDVGDKDRHMATFKKNMTAAARKCTTFTLQSEDSFLKLLDGKIDAFHANDSSYVDSFNSCFDQSLVKHHCRKHMVTYAVTSYDKPEEVDEWYKRGSSGDRCALVVRNDKVVKGFVNGCGSTRDFLKHHTDKANVSPMTDCSCTAITHDLSNISKDAFEKDLSDLPPEKLWKAIGVLKNQDPHRYSSHNATNETWIISGLPLEHISHVKYFRSVPKFSKSQKEALKAHGIRVIDKRGKDITDQIY